MKTTTGKVLLILALCFFTANGIMLYKGYDKMTNYYNSENYSALNENAYVGGDAYNYIINGNYATGFFVLAMGCLISGMLCVTSALIIQEMPAQTPAPIPAPIPAASTVTDSPIFVDPERRENDESKTAAKAP